MSTVPVVNGQTYRLVAQLDFDNDKLNLWVDPTAADLATPDATRAYTNTNWSSAVRLASGGTGSTTWDNLVVATDWSDPGLVPEPSMLWLGGIGALALLRRRRESLV
jgi:MYXO-CTERM domain-containing protein